jgi:hypothetical protein
MRVIVAFLLGIAVTVGGAYYHDTSMAKPNSPQDQLVNWEVARGLADSVVEQASGQFSRLFSR